MRELNVRGVNDGEGKQGSRGAGEKGRRKRREKGWGGTRNVCVVVILAHSYVLGRMADGAHGQMNGIALPSETGGANAGIKKANGRGNKWFSFLSVTGKIKPTCL